MSKEKFIEEWMPDMPYGSEKLRERVRSSMQASLNDVIHDAIEDFCEKHNLCPICITGRWNCESDHK